MLIKLNIIRIEVRGWKSPSYNSFLPWLGITAIASDSKTFQTD